MRGLALALLLSCATPVPRAEVVKAEHPHAEALAVLEGEAREAFELLADTDDVAYGAVGAHGGLSRESSALRLLVRHPDAQVAVGALWRSENRVARLYALAAFWYLRPREYRAALESLRGDETRVETQSGCSIIESTVAGVLGEPQEDGLSPGAGSSDARCLGGPIESMELTMESGYLPISLIEGLGGELNLCSRPSAEWPRLNLPAARPNVEAEQELQRLREAADLNPPAPIDYEVADEVLLRSAGLEP